MEREEMISRLSSIGLRAAVTVSTMDMGLQYDFITPKGAGTGFGGMGDWPALAFGPIHEAQWKGVLDGIRNGEVTLELLKDTGLDTMVQEIYTLEELDYADVLKNLLPLENHRGVIYCLFDTAMCYAKECRPEFFTSRDELEKHFIRDYCGSIALWEDMCTDELESWLNRLDDDLSEFHIYLYPCYGQEQGGSAP